MNRLRAAFTSGVAAVLIVVSGGTAAEWGDLSATFVFDGDVPAPVPAMITSEKEFCSGFHVMNESLVVNSKNRGVANVVLFLYLARGAEKPPIHESYQATEKNEVLLDNKQCRFAPHVLLLRTTQTLVVGNSDSVSHNTNIALFKNPLFNQQILTGEQKKLQFNVEETLPGKVACNIHPWMNSWLVIKEHPYMAVSDENGKLDIKSLPLGTWTFQVWHEKAGYLREVKFEGGSTDARGRFSLAIKAGANDLGQIKLAGKLFE